ncbi:MAG: hypothetical protein KY469_02720 [Actinobacteria bacterium]|nr:hypothetical protein [Actinomycetota bacterium]
MIGTRGVAAAMIAVVALTTACSAASDLADEVQTAAEDLRPEPVEQPDAQEDPAPPPQEPGAPTAPPATEAPARDDAGEPPTEAQPPPPPIDDAGGVGANGRAILRAAVPRLVFEVDVQEGVAPSQAALDHLTAVAGGVVDKPGGIGFAGGNTFVSDRTEWTRDALRDAVAANRSQFSGGDAVVVYVLYLRGGFFRDGGQTGSIGVAFSASEFALFPQRWQSLTNGLLGGRDAIERAVLVHELGHLLGLVNLTYQSPIDHEDPDNPGHSSNRGSVMYWAIESDAIAQVFDGPPPDRFDDADRQDLEGLRSGRL